MCNRTCFDSFLHLGDASETPGLDEGMLADLGIDIALFTKMKLLRKLPMPSEIECGTCDGYAELIFEQKGGKPAIYANCPHCGFYKPDIRLANRWTPDFTPIFQVLRKELNCDGELSELIPGILWNIGRCALSGQSREVFATAGINTWRNAEIIRLLPQGTTPILIALGDRPLNEKLGAFSPDRVFLVSSLMKLSSGCLSADITPIKQGFDLLNMLYEPPKRSSGKNAKIGDATKKLRQELRHFMEGVFSDMESAERHGREYQFSGISQKALAEMLGTTPVMVNRAIKQDTELSGLYACANDPQRAYSYGMRVMNRTI